MKIAFICNQNQARSQVLSSVFAALLPNDEFSSFGLIAGEGTPLPLIIEAVFLDWGLDPSGQFARNMGLHWEQIQEMQVVIAVSSFIAEEIKVAGFGGEILDLEQEAKRLGIAIADPQLMPRRQCAFELAKYVKVAVSALQGIGTIKRDLNILALIPENEAAIEKTIARALSLEKVGKTVLLGDLIVPPSPAYLQNTESAIRFKVEESTSSVGMDSSPEDLWIYLPKAAALCPASVYLSNYWQEFVLGIATESLIIVTPPQKNARGKLAESYLCALYANEIQVVQS
jgi:protein-tyrosine-phosphatase